MQTNRSQRWGKNISISLSKADKPDLKKAVMDFLEKNPEPSDDAWHAWAEREGFDVHQAEAVAYALAGRLVKFLRGGRSKGVRPTGASDEEVVLGVEIESEHVDDEEIQRKIAYDHLEEFENYNTELRDMEERLNG